MRGVAFIWFNLLVIIGVSQSNPRAYLFEKAKAFYQDGNVQQARYYYLLSLKQDGDFPSDIEIKQEVVKLDSTEAYGADSKEFLKLITKADSLRLSEKYIEAMKFFDDASSLEPAYDYPYARIDQIIEASAEIKKKLLIYNAKQNQLSYVKTLGEIEALESDGFEVEAYFRYQEFSKAFHGDTLAQNRASRLRVRNDEQIKRIIELLDLGDVAYYSGDLNLAREAFEEAMEINPKCQACVYRLDQISYCEKQEVNQTKDFEENLKTARSNFKTGKYQTAYYQFSWLQKQQPDNVELSSYVEKLEELMQAETDERMRKFNADITLEKANEEFVAGNFEGALTYYSKLKNAYADVIDYLQFVELRIAECVNELEQ